MPSNAKNRHCALARANRAFGTDEKRIRTKSTVMDKSKGGLGVAFIQVLKASRPRKIEALPQRGRDSRRHA
jgi:hypothetical protein